MQEMKDKAVDWQETTGTTSLTKWNDLLLSVLCLDWCRSQSGGWCTGVGMTASEGTIQAMMARYSDKAGNVKFDDFVACFIKLKSMQSTCRQALDSVTYFCCVSFTVVFCWSPRCTVLLLLALLIVIKTGTNIYISDDWYLTGQFLPHTAMQDVRLSHAGIMSKRLRISSNFFCRLVATPF